MNITPQLSIIKIFILSFLICSSTGKAPAQVGIGTTNPHVSSMLDVSSDSQGVLIPRMTTTERDAIATPANSLLVYDTDESSYFYYDESTSTWIRINSSAEIRDNYVLVKSEADFPSPSGGVITLDADTYYEINGTINLSASIDLNGAYLSGIDAWEDVLVYSGTIFVGSSGGSIRNITMTGGGTAFDITGGATFMLQNSVVSNMASVGSISNVGLYFSNIVLFNANTNGITYDNLGYLLLSNQAWFDNNSGTYETFTGSFGLIQKSGGYSIVNGSATAIDVSDDPIVVGGVITGTVFGGTGTFVESYTNGTYPDYNFNKNWLVESPRLPVEKDAEAYGNIYITTPQTTSISTLGDPVKVNGTTTAERLFRASTPQSNRITYEGTHRRTFNIQASLSGYLPSGSNVNYTFYVAKNGTILPSTAIQTKFASGSGGSADVRALSFTGTVSLEPDDYIEIWVQNDTDTSDITISTLNLLIY